MVNIGFLWGFGLGLLLLLAVYIYVRKRIKKEVIKINVKRPEEESSGTSNGYKPTSSSTTTTEQRVEGRTNREEPDGELEEQGDIQTEPTETIEPDESGDKQHSPAIPPPEPFKY